MRKLLHIYYNGKAVELDTDHIEAMNRGDDNLWGPEHDGPSDYTRVSLKTGCVTSDKRSVVFVAETPQEILSL